MDSISLQLAHQLTGKNVLLVGAGAVAITRLPKLLPTGCRLTVIAPEIEPEVWEHFDKTSSEELQDYIDEDWTADKHNIYRIINRGFENTDLVLYGDGSSSQSDKDAFLSSTDPNYSFTPSVNKGWHMVLTCIPDPKLSERIFYGAKLVLGQQVMCNVADNPPLCDYYFGSNVTLGGFSRNDSQSRRSREKPIQILISSNGNSPRFTALLKQEIQRKFKSLPIGLSVARLGDLRAAIRKSSEEKCPTDFTKAQLLKFRMDWIRKCTDAFGIDYCYRINVEKTTRLFEQMLQEKRLDLPPREVLLEDYLDKP